MLTRHRKWKRLERCRLFGRCTKFARLTQSLSSSGVSSTEKRLSAHALPSPSVLEVPEPTECSEDQNLPARPDHCGSAPPSPICAGSPPKEEEPPIVSDAVAPQSDAKELGSPDGTAEKVTFESLGLCPELCWKCQALGWTYPTPVQRESLPHSLQGRDIIGLAETGSGKTGAFCLPILQSLLEHPDHKGVFALILAPTRELTVQITQQLSALGSDIFLKVCAIFGGVDMVSQAMELAKKPHVVVASPGRLLDHLQNTRGFHLATLQYLVLDEADRLLDLDFEEAIDMLLEILPSKRRTMLFSATMTDRVSKLQKASLINPVKIYVSAKYDTVKNLVQNMKVIPLQYKWTYLVALISHLRHYSIIVFVNTCVDAQKLAMCLQRFRFAAICLHGKMSQPQRLGALNAFKSGNKRVLVTTEVASRGLDIPDVDIVVNFDVPFTSKDYIHRVGRTARAGKSGRAITLVTVYDVETFQRIELALNKKMDPYEQIAESEWKMLHPEVEEAKL